MANAVFLSKINKNLETYGLIWLDASVNNSQENIQAQQQLRASINHLLTFEDDQLCLQYINSLPKDDRNVLIVSGRLGRIIVPQIVHLRQIIAIYIYCMDKKANEQWALHFSKVKGVMVRLDDLVHQIQTDQTQRQHHKIDEALSISVFNSNADDEGQSSTGLNGQFIHSQLLIDCLIRMESLPNEKQELITFCKQQYKDNPTDLEIVKEFERDYLSQRSLWWYTRQSFLYRLLNAALRLQNIDLLYLFRFFIRDLGQELGKNKCSLPIPVYRGQRMSKEEIELLQKSVGQYISMNSFLSTSLNRQGARSFLQSADTSDDVEQVFFEIDADPRLDNIKPFSDITLLSCLPTEKEVLFMIGSIFRIVEMKRESDGIWNIRMTLCSENDHQLQSLFQHMKNELGTGTTDLYTFGRVLRQMSRLSDAEKYYHRYLNQLSADHPNISLCYGALGRVTSDKGEYDSSLNWHNKSLEIEMKTLRSYHPDIAFTHNSIAVVYSMKGDYGHALESYEKALMIWKKALMIWKKAYDEDHPQVATCLDNMGCVYQLQKKYFQALQFHQKALILRQKHLPTDHPEIGASHNNIGNIHRCLGNYDQALEHYILDLNISKKSLPPEHPGIGETLVNIGLVHEGKGDYQQALSYLNKAINIFLHSLSPTHPSVIKTDQCIKHVLAKWK